MGVPPRVGAPCSQSLRLCGGVSSVLLCRTCLEIVLVLLGCRNRTPQTEWLISNRNFLLIALEAGSPRSEHPRIPCLVRAHFLDHRWPPSLCPLTGKGVRELSGVAFMRILISFTRTLSLWPEYLPKAPFLNTIMLGIEFQHMNFGGGDTNIQATAAAMDRAMTLSLDLQYFLLTNSLPQCRQGGEI